MVLLIHLLIENIEFSPFYEPSGIHELQLTLYKITAKADLSESIN